MCNIKYEDLEIDHLVEFTKDSTIFAAARENGSGRIRLFLINQATSNVYSRNGSIDSWEEVCGDHRLAILARLIAAKQGGTPVPVYRINGSHN